MQNTRNLLFACFIFLIALIPVWSQTDTEQAAAANVSSYIGMKLDELIARFSIPRYVYTSRGLETWQDDVVFVYNEGEFYIFKDRVWQLGLKSYYGISVGDPKPAAVLALSSEAVDYTDYMLLALPPVGWPLMLRVNFNAAGRVSAIYIYRPDF